MEHDYDGRGGCAPDCGSCRIDDLQAALASPSTPSPAPSAEGEPKRPHPNQIASARAAEALLVKLPPETDADPDYGF